MKGDTRCENGRRWRHDPQFDDPYLETDIGQCPECEGHGCGEYKCGDCGFMVEAMNEAGQCEDCERIAGTTDEDETAAQQAAE